MTDGLVALKWFRFGQNNSGGYFINNDVVDEEVFIQAETADAAIEKAMELFAPYSEYCSCCGERWSYYVDDSDGTNEPMVYGEPLANLESSMFRRQAKLHYFDGRVETYVRKKKGSAPKALEE